MSEDTESGVNPRVVQAGHELDWRKRLSFVSIFGHSVISALPFLQE